MSTPSSFSLCYYKSVLYFREGWNYLLELYFWILIGALLLVSLTIYFARPPPSNTNKYNYDTLDGQIVNSLGHENPHIVDEQKHQNEEDNKESEEEITKDEIIKIEKRRWALGFVILGSSFTMFGAILLFVLDYDFTNFLGSCMMYVGIISLIKGMSIELQKDNNLNELFSSVFFILIFFINFFLLTDLLNVIGSLPWSLRSDTGKLGDLALIYILPYFIWKLVPTFGNSQINYDDRFYFIKVQSAVRFCIFNYALLIATSLEFIMLPILNQYISGGFQASLYLVLYSITINLFGYRNEMNSVHDFLDLFESNSDKDSEEVEK